jgi:hypothetical protein
MAIARVISEIFPMKARSVAMMSSTVANWASRFRLPETKGRSLEEISRDVSEAEKGNSQPAAG